MRRMFRALSLFLCISIIISSCMIFTKADDETEFKNSYPFIMVHGMFGWGDGEGINKFLPYWGATAGNIERYLSSSGYEIHCASVGPISSSWDDACELYAQIVGGTVDYGEAHSARHDHLRYGRTYTTPLVPDWGKLDNSGRIKKIHIIGHSQGGNAARLLVDLLTNGSAEEIAATPADDISPLFTGGKADWIESCTAICSPMNPVTIYYELSKARLIPLLKIIIFLYAALAGRSNLNGKVVDFHLEQFGLTNIPGKNNAAEIFDAILRCYKAKDSVAESLSPQGILDFNKSIEISDNVYYFSYAFDSTERSETTGKLHTEYAKLGLLKILSDVIIRQGKITDKKTGLEFDERWAPNDGLVNVISALHPDDEPFVDYDGGELNPGVWNVMPVQKGDHGTAIGLLADEEETRLFYGELAKLLVSVERIENT
ncbi:MAG: hypothetical protein K5643_03240 [Saccharofermentans sp.]|nr:hypothetical protein [Saccharofermentans sp.]